MTTARALLGAFAFALPVFIATEVQAGFLVSAVVGIIGGVAAAFIWGGSITGGWDHD